MIVKASLVALAGGLVYAKSQRRARDKIIEAQYSRREKLLKNEEVFVNSGLFVFGACTWFKGDAIETAEFLRKRLEKIVQLNPWLVGRVVKYKGDFHLVFNEGKDLDLEQSMKEVLVVLDEGAGGVTVDSTSVEVSQACSETNGMVKDPRIESQLRVCLLPSGDNFAMVYSLSHLVADGFTFYRIYKMLIDQNTPIEAMEPERVHHFDRLQDETLGRLVRRMTTSLGFIHHLVFGTVYETITKNKLFPNKEVGMRRTYLVDNDDIAKIKANHDPKTTGVPFISTNDIITSWYFKNGGARFSYMTVNLRGRIKEIRDSHCGVYDGLIFSDSPEQVDSPAAIRKSILNLKKSDSSFSQWESLQSGHLFITNWASVSGLEPMDPPNCEEICHYPLALSIQMGPMAAMAVVFRFSPGKIGVYVNAGRKLPHTLDKKPDFADELLEKLGSAKTEY